jgi:hypothetical protein
MPRNDLPESRFRTLLEDLGALPDWLKQTLVIFLRESLKSSVELVKLNTMTAKDSLFLYVPKLTRSGQAYLDTLRHTDDKIDKRIVEFINAVKKQKNLIDIAQDNDWTLKMCCYYVLKAWEKNIILPTYSKNVYALVRLMADDIDLGEYLVRIGKISKEQYNWVSKMKKTGMMESITDVKSEETDVYINLGYLTDSELVSIKELLELADKKSLVEDPNTMLVVKLRELQKEVAELHESNSNLEEEKDSLEKTIKKLAADLEFQKKESVQYAREIELLKNELKKALKG